MLSIIYTEWGILVWNGEYNMDTRSIDSHQGMKNLGFHDARASSWDDVLPMDVFALMRSDYIILMLERILSLSYIIPQECHDAPHEEEE